MALVMICILVQMMCGQKSKTWTSGSVSVSTSLHHALVGYAADGFGLYNVLDQDGGTITNEVLDECHGHEHEIDWDGVATSLYHYHETHAFPYALGCLRGPEQ